MLGLFLFTVFIRLILLLFRALLQSKYIFIASSLRCDSEVEKSIKIKLPNNNKNRTTNQPRTTKNHQRTTKKNLQIPTPFFKHLYPHF